MTRTIIAVLLAVALTACGKDEIKECQNFSTSVASVQILREINNWSLAQANEYLIASIDKAEADGKMTSAEARKQRGEVLGILRVVFQLPIRADVDAALDAGAAACLAGKHK
jgi:hypothetical protein